jgi:hypothetical protein
MKGKQEVGRGISMETIDKGNRFGDKRLGKRGL